MAVMFQPYRASFARQEMRKRPEKSEIYPVLDLEMISADHEVCVRCSGWERSPVEKSTSSFILGIVDRDESSEQHLGHARLLAGVHE